MNKRMVTILSALFLLFLCTAFNAFAKELCIPDMDADSGASVQIPVNVDNATGIAGYQFTITYNSSVLNCTGTAAGSLTAGWVKNQNLSVPNQVTVGGFQPDLIPLTGGSGSIVKLVCTVVGTPGQTTNICISSQKLSDENGAGILSTVCNNGCVVFTVTGVQLVDYYCDKDSDQHYNINSDGSCTQGTANCPPAGCQVTPGNDCNDTDNAIHPGATELCDGQNNDCNGATADGSGESWYGTACDGADTDLCKEGTYGCTGGVQSCSDTTGNNVETCDNTDNDCNPATADGSGEAWIGTPCDGPDTDLCNEGTYSCISGAQTCSDNTGNNVETCDGQNNDCNGSTADGSGESWYGTACDGADTDLCKEGTYGCTGGTQSCSDSTGNTVEICNDTQDNDCDGATDCADTDCASACQQVSYYCDNDSDTYKDALVDGTCTGAGCQPAGCQVTPGNDCNDTDNAIHPGATELCDGKNNDCNGATADGSGESWYGDPTSCGVGVCQGSGQLTCSGGTQVDTCTEGPPQTEGPFGNTTCNDGKDNDCDGATDAADGGCVPAIGVSIPETTGNKGAVVAIPVNVDISTGIAGFQFTITYNLSVLNCTGTSVGSLTTVDSDNDGVNDWTITSNATPGQMIFGGVDATLIGLPGGSGSLVKLMCNVVGNIGDSTSLDFTYSKLVDSSGEEISSTTNSGTFVIGTGDLDGDGDIDKVDYQIFVSAFGKCEGKAGFNANADYDGDGCITFVDYQKWYRYYMNQ